MIIFVSCVDWQAGSKYDIDLIHFQFRFLWAGVSETASVVTADSTIEAAGKAFIHPVLSHFIVEVMTKLINEPKKNTA